jgi:hypothetical protein
MGTSITVDLSANRCTLRAPSDRVKTSRMAGPIELHVRPCLTLRSTPDLALRQPPLGFLYIKPSISCGRSAGARPVNAGVRPKRGADPPGYAKMRRLGSNQLTFLIGRMVR